MNAKEEFLRLIVDKPNVLCATISHCSSWDEKSHTHHHLKVSYTQEDYDKFIESLDFEYDDGYGGQELYGIVWFKDDTWAERGEYDGAEWWEYRSCPIIPKSLLF